jgi:hypothetical protein
MIGECGRGERTRRVEDERELESGRCSTRGSERLRGDHERRRVERERERERILRGGINTGMAGGITGL